MKKIILLLSAIIMAQALLYAQQSPDLNFTPSVESARYANGKGPKVGIDGAHNNLHQLDGGFAPFGKLLKADGYQTAAVDEITEEQLKALDIFVIANPLHESNIGNWKNPTPSAFTDKEIKLIASWVEEGGSLLLIADHMPFGGAANELAQQFGFAYENGFVMAKAQQWPPESYHKSDKTLSPSVLTMGVDSLAGFTGSALKPAEGAMVIGRFSDTHQLLLPEVAWQFEENTVKKPLQDYVMGAAMKYGKGKVALFTEAAMFTAQIVQEKYKVGFNSPRAPQNQQFVLNVLHWLDEDSPESRVYENLWAMKQAYEADDMQKVASLYTKDGVIYQPSGGEVRGMEAIQAYWQGLKGKGISWDSWLLEVEPMGDQILAVFRLDLSYKNYEDKAVTSPSKAMLIYKKEEGEYKLYRDFYTPVKQ